jgi:hydrogenase nickel incorporation protein HypA/HybF
MHEYSIVSSLLARVDESLQSYKVTSVRRLHLRIGELSGVEPELLRTAYDMCRLGTSCEQADLEVHEIAARWMCRACNAEPPKGGRLACPSCGGRVTLAAGDEIVLDRIELEVDDV